MRVVFSLKTKQKWRGADRYKVIDYAYPCLYFQHDDDNIYLCCARNWGREPRKYFLTIQGYKHATALQVLNALEDIGNRNRIVDDVIFKFYKDKELPLGSVKSILKPLKM